MSKRRDEVLGLLGVERWLPRSAVGQVPPVALQVAASPVPAAVASVGAALPLMAPAAAGSGLQADADWQGLRAQVADCTRCKLCKTRTKTVFGIGHPLAELMVVGEGPGADEDASGEPFVGRAGKLLDEMLKAIGRSRALGAETAVVNAATLSPLATQPVFIANVVKCRPPGNRDPEKDEVEACRNYLDAQIAHVKPKLIVALGRIAAQRLLGNDEPLSRLRGPIHHYGALKTPVFVTYHPAYLLRAPKEKAKSWEDLKKIAQYLKAHG
ncbi:MAG: uracil-DNA glycosylase [Pseudomonadota bacterium]